jgi:hypothetical protein
MKEVFAPRLHKRVTRLGGFSGAARECALSQEARATRGWKRRLEVAAARPRPLLRAGPAVAENGFHGF